jgi:hypothetical protein
MWPKQSQPKDKEWALEPRPGGREEEEGREGGRVVSV